MKLQLLTPAKPIPSDPIVAYFPCPWLYNHDLITSYLSSQSINNHL